jgi:hypothetical protein
MLSGSPLAADSAANDRRAERGRREKTNACPSEPAIERRGIDRGNACGILLRSQLQTETAAMNAPLTLASVGMEIASAWAFGLIFFGPLSTVSWRLLRLRAGTAPGIRDIVAYFLCQAGWFGSFFSVFGILEKLSTANLVSPEVRWLCTGMLVLLAIATRGVAGFARTPARDGFA